MAFYYNLPTDNYVTASVTVASGTPDATYPVANLYNDNLAQPFKFTALAGGVSFLFYIDLGGPHTVRFASLHNTRGDSAADYLLLSADDAAISVNVALFHFSELGSDTDGYSIDPYIASALASATARRYWAIAPAANCTRMPHFGRWWLSASLRSLDTNFRADLAPDRGHPATTLKTTMRVTLAYPVGIRTEMLTGTLRVSASDFVKLRTLSDVAGETLAFPIVLDSASSSIVSTSAGAQLVRFAPGYTFSPRFTPNAGRDLMDVPVSFMPVSRGLVF